MGSTITEKIIAEHAGKDSVKPGEIVEARIDLAMSNDVTAPVAIKELEKAGIDTVFDPDRIILVPDHWTPQKDIRSAEACKIMRAFAKDHGIKNIYEIGRGGIEHALLPDNGHVAPGELVIGADSHTCTYGALGAFSTGMGSSDIAAGMALGTAWLRVPEQIRAVFTGRRNKWVTGKDMMLWLIGTHGVDGARYKTIELGGPAIRELEMDDRFSMCNMGIEAGGKNCIIEPDNRTEEFVRGRVTREYKVYKSDADAEYAEVWNFNLEELEPIVARPFLPSNTCFVRDLEKKYM